MNCGKGLATAAASDPRSHLHLFFLTIKTTPFPPLPTNNYLRYPNRTRTRFCPPLRAQARLNDGLVIEEELSFYELLGISETGTFPEIKQAYKQLARKYHPDVSPPDRVEENTRRFIRVQEAYETLSDPRLRAVYDSDLAKGIRFAFNARRRRSSYDEEMEEKSEWKNRWQDQLSELRKRCMNKKDARGHMSWAARMRKQREEMTRDS